MPDIAKISTLLDIRYPAEQPLWAENHAAIRQKVEDYLPQLLAGLKVPGIAKVNWAKQPKGNETLEVSIHGTPARLRFVISANFNASVEEYVYALCEDISRNRALFVTPALVHHVMGKNAPPSQPFDEKGWERIVQILFAQGFGLQRIEQYAPPADSQDNTPETWAEACIGDLEATQLVLHGHPGQIDPDDNPEDFNRLIEGTDFFVDAAFKVKGIPFPKIKGEKQKNFAPGEIALQINDLRFPLRQIGDVQTENLRFVNFLTSNGACFLNRGSVNFLLDSLEPANPNLLALVRTRFGTDFIVAVLRNLAAEGISVRPLVRILEILISGGQDLFRQQPEVSVAPPLSETIHLVVEDKTPEQIDLADWSELVRMNLKNAIINRALPHFDEPLVLSCFFLDNVFLEKIAHLDSLGTAEKVELRDNLCRKIAQNYFTPAGKIRPIISSTGWRKKISELIAFEFPDTPVFSLQECLPRIIAKFDLLLTA